MSGEKDMRLLEMYKTENMVRDEKEEGLGVHIERPVNYDVPYNELTPYEMSIREETFPWNQDIL